MKGWLRMGLRQLPVKHPHVKHPHPSMLEGANPLKLWPDDSYHVGHSGEGVGVELAQGW